MKDKHEVSFMVRRISEYFEIPFPEISYTWKGTRGNANYSRKGSEIRTWLNLPIGTWIGIEQLICHESAHLVHFKKQDYRSTDRSHGREFTEILIEVTKFVKEEFNFEYNFGLDYPEVAKHAGATVVPYGYARKRIAAINALMLLGNSKEDAERVLNLAEGMRK